MRRVQLNFDEETYMKLALIAKKQQKSISAITRKLVAKYVAEETPKPNGHALMGLIELGKKLQIRLPKDLAENHDYYLYGEGSPKFGTKRKK